jgi:type III secretion system low calcium response chaperone LcrH/SycD
MSDTTTADWVAENAGAIAAHFQNGGTAGQLKGINARHLEAVYTVGLAHYEAARYKDARLAFSFCTQNDHLERRYYMALASTYKMLSQPAEALKYYTVASMLDIKDPMPTFHTAECLVVMGMVEEAKEALEIVIRQSADEISLKPLHERATAMLAALAGAPTPKAGE